MSTIQFESQVGDDGVLSLRIPLGPGEAKKRVIVTVEPVPAQAPASDEAGQEWHAFVERTYGCCANLGLEEPEDLPLQPRD